MKKWAIFIDGRPVTPGKSDYLPVHDKATGRLLAGVPVCSADYVDLALQSAKLAFEKWAGRSPQERAGWLHQAAHVVRGESPGLARLLLAETGRSPASVGREMRALAALLDFYAEEGVRLPAYSPGQGSAWTVNRQVSVGGVVALLPADSPLLALGRVLAPALAAGCSVVAKPAPATPLTTLRLAALLGEAGLPAGLFNVVTGPGEETGQKLIAHTLTGKIVFCGELEAGRQVAIQAAQTDKPLILEPGQPGQAIIAADADLAKVAPALVEHSFADAGQQRGRINRLYVHTELYAEATARLAQAAAQLAVAPSHHPTNFMGALVKESRQTQLQNQLQRALEQGANLLCGGQRLTGPDFEPGCYWPPTILIDATAAMPVMRGASVGPLLAVMKVETLDEAIRTANAGGPRQDVVLFSQDLSGALQAAVQLRAASVWLNRLPSGPGHVSGGEASGSGDLLPERWGIKVEDYLVAQQIHLAG